MACKHILKVRRFSLYILIALLFVSMSVTAGLAAPPPDPYADVQSIHLPVGSLSLQVTPWERLMAISPLWLVCWVKIWCLIWGKVRKEPPI